MFIRSTAQARPQDNVIDHGQASTATCRLKFYIWFGFLETSEVFGIVWYFLTGVTFATRRYV